MKSEERDWPRRWVHRLVGPGLRRAFVRDFSAVAVLRVGGGALLFVSQLLLAAWMGPEGFGTYSFAWACVAVLSTLAGLGLAGTSVRFISKYEAEGDAAHLRGMLRFNRLATLGSAGLVMLLGLLGVSLFAPDSPYHDALRLSFLAIPVIAILNLESAYARGFNWMALATLAEQMARPVLIIVLAWLVTVGFRAPTTELYVLACALAYLFATAGQHRAVNGRIARRIGGGPRQADAGPWLRVAVAMLLLNGSQILRMNTDPLLVGLFLEPADVGIYTAAMRTATLVAFPLLVASNVAQPRISSLHTEGSHEELAGFAASATRGMLLVSVGLAVFIAVVGRDMLELFGEEFVAGYPALLILSVAHVAAAAFGPVTSLLTMTGHQRVAAWTHGTSLFTGVVLNVLLIPVLGIAGAALATGTNAVLVQAVLFVAARRRLETGSPPAA